MTLSAFVTAAAVAAGLTLGPAVAVAPPATAATARAMLADYVFDYETGTEGWVTKKDDKLPDGEVVWSRGIAKSGTRSLDFWLDGGGNDGTLWVERAIPVPPGQPTINIELSFWEWNDGDDKVTNWPIIAYADRMAPTAKEDRSEERRVGKERRGGWAAEREEE